MDPSILIVDDFASVRLYHSAFLTRQGYDCVAVDDGAEGLALLRTQPVDLILLDLVMPKMNGSEFIRQVRAEPRLAAIPILVITSTAPPADIARREGQGVTVLRKPVTPAALLEKVRQLIPPAARRGPSNASHAVAG